MREMKYPKVVKSIDIYLPRHYMLSMVNITIHDEARNGLSDSEKLASMVSYREGEFSKFYVTLDNTPDLFEAFIMGREFNNLYLYRIEVGIDGMIFHATSTDLDINDDYLLIVPFVGTSGTIVVSGHEGKEAYEIHWDDKWLKRYAETINGVYAEYELRDTIKREYLVTEQNPATKRPLCAID